MHSTAFRIALLFALIFAGFLYLGNGSAPLPPDQVHARSPVPGLPPEAISTLDRIQRGGPFPYRQDGTIFHNREGLLPAKSRGYYREYTVTTPGARDRGARRFVTGGDPPEVIYYTDDHYRSFRRVVPSR